MGIIPVTCYTLRCDGCKTELEDYEENTAFDSGTLFDLAYDKDWEEVKGELGTMNKWYCKECSSK